LAPNWNFRADELFVGGRDNNPHRSRPRIAARALQALFPARRIFYRLVWNIARSAKIAGPARGVSDVALGKALPAAPPIFPIPGRGVLASEAEAGPAD